MYTFEYEALFFEAGARAAERLFFLRSIRWLRFWSTIGPPLFFGASTIVFYFWIGDTWSVRLFGAIFVLSLLSPVCFYFARSAAAARMARQAPVRRVRMNSAGLSVETSGNEVTILWNQFRCVWDCENYLLLVIGPYGSLNLPKQGMPVGAQEFIKQSIGER